MAYDVSRSFTTIVASTSPEDDCDLYEALQHERNFVFGTGETAMTSGQRDDDIHLTSELSPVPLFTDPMWSSSIGSQWSTLFTPATSSWPSMYNIHEVQPVVQSARLPPKLDWKSVPSGTMTPNTTEYHLTQPYDRGIGASIQLSRDGVGLKHTKSSELARVPRTPASSQFPITEWLPSTSRERADQPRDRLVHLSTTINDRFENVGSSVDDDISPKTSPAETRPVVSEATAKTGPGADECSLASQPFSEHYTVRHPELAGVKSDVWSERHHAHSLRRALKDPNADWVESYAGAMTALSALNPEQYQMPFGTRVVNIKTDISRNILLSIRCGKYAFLEKVSERIMKAWDARESPSEKVLFLFSVNGGKRYTGIAEMSGPWDPNMTIENWETHADSQKCVGGIPVTWIYAKDVAYHQFSHIRQPNNGHPVGNMWNGMNFGSDIGRIVIETYVQSPSTSSILGFPKNYPENAHLGQEHLTGVRRSSRSSHSNLSNTRPHVPPPITVRNPKRLERVVHHAIHDNGSPTPTARMALRHDALAPPPKFILPTDASSMRETASLTNKDKVSPIVDCERSCEVSNNKTIVTPARSGNAHAVPYAHPSVSDINTDHELTGPRYIQQAGGVLDLRQIDFQLPQKSNGYRDNGQSNVYKRTDTTPQYMVPQTTMHGANKRPSFVGRESEWQYNNRLVHSSSLPQFPQRSSSQAAAEDQVSLTAKPVDQYDMRYARPQIPLAEHTPSHRPRSGFDMGQRVAALPPAYLSLNTQTIRPPPNTRQKEAHLKSELHALMSAKFAVDVRLEDELRGPLRQDLITKSNHLVTQYRELEKELASLGFTDMENLSISTPARHGSSDSSAAVTGSSVEAFNVSPVYAADGRVLRSASKHRTPPSLSTLPSAPSRRGHAFTPSFDLRLVDNVDKLVAGSDDGSTQKTDSQTTNAKSPQWTSNGGFRPRVDSHFGPVGSGPKRNSIHLSERFERA